MNSPGSLFGALFPVEKNIYFPPCFQLRDHDDGYDPAQLVVFSLLRHHLYQRLCGFRGGFHGCVWRQSGRVVVLRQHRDVSVVGLRRQRPFRHDLSDVTVSIGVVDRDVHNHHVLRHGTDMGRDHVDYGATVVHQYREYDLFLALVSCGITIIVMHHRLNIVLLGSSSLCHVKTSIEYHVLT